MQRLDEGVRRLGEVHVVIALNGLIDEWEPE